MTNESKIDRIWNSYSAEKKREAIEVAESKAEIKTLPADFERIWKVLIPWEKFNYLSREDRIKLWREAKGKYAEKWWDSKDPLTFAKHQLFEDVPIAFLDKEKRERFCDGIESLLGISIHELCTDLEKWRERARFGEKIYDNLNPQDKTHAGNDICTITEKKDQPNEKTIAMQESERRTSHAKRTKKGLTNLVYITCPGLSSEYFYQTDAEGLQAAIDALTKVKEENYRMVMISGPDDIRDAVKTSIENEDGAYTLNSERMNGILVEDEFNKRLNLDETKRLQYRAKIRRAEPCLPHERLVEAYDFWHKKHAGLDSKLLEELRRQFSREQNDTLTSKLIRLLEPIIKFCL